MKSLLSLIILLTWCRFNSVSQIPEYLRHQTGWVCISAETFKSLPINHNKVQTTYAQNQIAGNDSADSFVARIYVDHSGTAYYWINCSYGKKRVEKSKLADNTVKIPGTNPVQSKNLDLLVDSASLARQQQFINETVAAFSSDFIIKPQYTIHPETNKEVFVYGFGVEGKTLINGQRNIVLKNVTTNEEYSIMDSTNNSTSLSSLLVSLFDAENTTEGLEYFLLLNNRTGIGENIDFLKPYFSSRIPDAPAIYPKFKPISNAMFAAISRAIEKFNLETAKSSGSSGDGESLHEKRIQFKGK